MDIFAKRGSLKTVIRLSEETVIAPIVGWFLMKALIFEAGNIKNAVESRSAITAVGAVAVTNIFSRAGYPVWGLIKWE